MLCRGELPGFWAVCLFSLISTWTWYVGVRTPYQPLNHLLPPHALSMLANCNAQLSTLQYFFTETYRAVLRPLLRCRRSIIVDRLWSIVVKPTGSACPDGDWECSEIYTSVLTPQEFQHFEVQLAPKWKLLCGDTEMLWPHVCQSVGN